MSTRLENLRILDPVLTTIAQGYANSKFLVQDLLPTISVKHSKGKIPVYGRDSFVVRNTDRAMRADSNRIAPIDYTLVDFETKEKDIEVALDYLESDVTSGLIRYEQKLTKDLVSILELGKEKEIADYLQNPANYSNDMKQSLTADTAFDNYSSSTDPVTLIKNAMNAIRARTAKLPNTLIMGDPVYRTLMSHPAIINKIKYSGSPILNGDLVKELFEVDSVLVGRSVYSNDGINFTDLWLDNLIVAYIDKNDSASRSEFNPSLGYILQKEGHPEIDTYYENGGKIKVIRATDNYTWKITAPDCAYIISNTTNS